VWEGRGSGGSFEGRRWAIESVDSELRIAGEVESEFMEERVGGVMSSR
jgi:hypothetical protein